VVIGAPGAGGSGRGAAYVYTRSCSPTCTWSFQQKLQNTTDFVGDSGTGDFFGHAVAIDRNPVGGSKIIVGAYGDTVAAMGSQYVGSTTIYLRSGTTWSAEQKISYGGNSLPPEFGIDVGISHDRAIIGAELYSASGNSGYGAAFVYVRSGGIWSSEASFYGSQVGGLLGQSVALENSTAVIGAPGETKAYVVERSTSWGTPSALSQTGADQTGAGVAISGNTIVVGTNTSTAAGQMYIYRKVSGVWTHRATLSPGSTNDHLGKSVGVDGNQMIAGAWGRSNGGSASFFVNARPRNEDRDGNGTSDLSVYRGSSPTPTPTPSYFYASLPGGLDAVQFGTSGDVATPGDFDGDGKMDPTVFRASDGYRYILKSTTGSLSAISFGLSTDIQLAGDFDGDGTDNATVYRPSNNTFYWSKPDLSLGSCQYGSSGDKPVIADIDGDGVAECTVFRPSNGSWYWYNTVTQRRHSIWG
jgi:hypothetical protein